MRREKQPEPASAPADRVLAARLGSLNPGQSAPDALGIEVRSLLVSPLRKGIGRQPVRDTFSEVFGDGAPSRWTVVDPRYLEVIAVLFNVDLDWLTGASGTSTPYSGVPLAVATKVPRSGEPIAKLRRTALSGFCSAAGISLLPAFMSYLGIATTVTMAVEGTLEFWPGAGMISVSVLAGACSFALVHEAIRSRGSAFSADRQLEDVVQAGLRLRLAETLYEYLAEDPELSSGEIAAALHGSFSIDDDLLTRLCTPRTRRRNELLHAAFVTGERWKRSKKEREYAL